MFTKCTSNRPQVNRILLGTYTIRSLLRRSSPRSLGKTPNCPPWARRPREPCPVNQTPVLPRARRSFALCSASGSQAGSHTRPLGLRPRGRLHSPPPEPVVTDAGPSLQREGPRRRDQGLGYRGDTQSCSHLGLAPIFGACDPGLPRPRLRAISPLRSRTQHRPVRGGLTSSVRSSACLGSSLGRWCNGSTADFGSACLGSNPSRPVEIR